MKFHMLLHTPEQIRMLGNLDIVDANRYFCCFFWFFVVINRSFLQRWEHFHVVAAKRVYALTQKRTKTVQADMERALARIEKNACTYLKRFFDRSQTRGESVRSVEVWCLRVLT